MTQSGQLLRDIAARAQDIESKMFKLQQQLNEESKLFELNEGQQHNCNEALKSLRNAMTHAQYFEGNLEDYQILRDRLINTANFLETKGAALHENLLKLERQIDEHQADFQTLTSQFEDLKRKTADAKVVSVSPVESRSLKS